MWLLIGIVLMNLVLYNSWLWFTQKLLLVRFSKRQLFLGVTISWLIGTSILYRYPILSTLYLDKWGAFPQQLTLWSWLTLLLYLSIIITLLYLSITKKNIGKLVSKMIWFIVIFIALYYIATGSINTDIITYYLFIATAEEFIKFTIGYSLYKKFSLSIHDIILFCIISSIWFSFIENIYYAREALQQGITTQTFTQWGTTLLQRWVVNNTVHILFTSLIAHGLLYWYKRLLTNHSWQINNTIVFIAAIILWIGMHWLYNSLVVVSPFIIVPVFILWGYLLLSYVFYQTNSLYITSLQEQQKNLT